MPGERESFCQRSVNSKITRSVGSHSRSIPSERRWCDTLPSKQAVAGSSPVSRSPSETVALRWFHRLTYDKQTVILFRYGGFFLCQKVSNGHLPSFLASTCLTFGLLTKVFATSHRQVVRHWNCFWSNYKACLQKKQGRQVFSQGPCQ